MHPKISSVLNNCALHALTPNILIEIQCFGVDSNYNNGFKAGYELLKARFALFYGFDNAMFTWPLFAGILRNYNSYDLQMILGPVLRSFMSVTMSTQSFKDALQTVEEFTLIHQQGEYAGRYCTLSPDTLWKSVAKELGFHIAYVQNNERRICGEGFCLRTVDLYHNGQANGAEHWELVAQVTSETCDLEAEKQSQLKHLIALFTEQTDIFPTAFNLIKMHVHLTEQWVLKGKNMAQDAYELSISALQISKFLNCVRIIGVSKDVAIWSLRPLQAEASTFINSYVLANPLNEGINNICKQIIANNQPHVPDDCAGYIAAWGEPINYPVILATPSVPSSKIFDYALVKSHNQAFGQIFATLDEQLRILEQKGRVGSDDYDPAYNDVYPFVLPLRQSLIDAANNFYSAGMYTELAYLQFKIACTTAITTAKPSFENHRGSWNDVAPFLKALLGLFAYVLIIPAGIVQCCSSHGAWAAFFGAPPTRSAQKLYDFENQLQEIQSQLTAPSIRI